jgi:hypothetical protein
VVIGIVWNLRRRSEPPMSLDVVEPDSEANAVKAKGINGTGGEK